MLEREREARSQAESVSAMKDEFLATLSHELRTPLNAMLGWAVMLRRGVRDEATLQRGLETIERNARAQASLIEDLLDMSRIIAGKVGLDVQEAAPASFIEAAVATVQPAAIAKNIELEMELDAAAGPVLGDPGRLQQVMWNLLSNAVKFTPSSGTVRVTLLQAYGDVVVRVADSGIGIPAEFLPHVFDRFRQADSSTTRRHGGLGLGLSIARQLVEMHGGTIEVWSEGLDMGATFTVRLPLRRSGAPLPTGVAAHAGQPLAGQADLSGVRVLVVDDMIDTLDLAAQVLAASGAIVVLADHAERALAAARAEAFDVVVSDIGMPGVDGYELARRLRAQGLDVPMIALTAFTREQDRERGLQAGFGAYLRKPLEPGELVAAIGSVLHERPWRQHEDRVTV
jgi:CheY-like chemotaxis protein